MTLFLDSPFWSSLVQALLHSLWQGALISVLLFLGWKVIPARLSNLRYALAISSLAVLVFAWLATWTLLERKETAGPGVKWTAHAAPAAAAIHPGNVASDGEQFPAHRQLPEHETSSAGSTPVLHSVASQWRAWAGLVWLIGVVLFQVRLFALVKQARRLVRSSEPVEDTAILSEFTRLLERFGLSGKVALWKSDTIGIAAVWGLVKPVILIPSAYLAGLPPAQLEAILAHELAHIRRHDFAVNLVQMAVEGLFFFNPFVWWISRRIRLEREACCDAMAVATTGERAGYALALTAAAEAAWKQHELPEPVLAMGKESGQLLDRVRRLLHPHGSPELRVPMASVAGILLVCVASLLLLKVSTGMALEVLSPAERLNRFAELRSAFPNYQRLDMVSRSGEPREHVTVRGRIRTHDGRPIPKGTRVRIQSRTPGYSGGYGASTDDNGAFATEVAAGTIHVSASAEGYAPDFAGPISDPAGLENIELILPQGFTASVRFLDPSGHPVGGVQVSARHEFPANAWNVEAASNSEGRVVFEHVGDQPVSMQAEASGYQLAIRREVTLKPNEVLTWTLEPAEPSTGVVVFADTGEPVKGAEIRLGRRTGPSETSYGFSYGKPWSPLLAETDEEGKFKLLSLRDDAQYYLLISGPGASGIVAGPIGAGEQDLRFELPRAKFLKIRVENVSREHLDKRARLELNYGITLRYGDSSHGTGGSFYSEPKKSVAEFEVGPLWKMDGGFHVTGQGFKMTWDEIVAQTEPAVIDLALREEKPPAPEPVTRPVRVVLQIPKDQVPPQGAVLFEFSYTNRWNKVLAEVKDGTAEARLPAPISAKLSPTGLIGYWFPPKEFTLAEESDPHQIELAAYPAGAIHGQVLEEDGRPASQLLISAIPSGPLPGGPGKGLGVDVKSSASSGDRQNRFMAGPLPFGGTYVICAYRGTTFVLSDPLQLDAETPFQEVTLTMPRGVELAGTVIRPDGRPFARQEVEFTFSPTAGHGFSGHKAVTGRDGRFSFSNVNPDAPGEYHLELKLTRDFQPVRKKVIPGEPANIQLEQGLVIEGRVIDHETGVALEGAELYAMRKNQGPALWEGPVWFNAEEKTDREGRFRFSNLPPGDYEINSRSGRVQITDRIRQAGSGEPILLPIEPYAWSKVKSGSGPAL
jgi:beta-lactamase regulating signal transducer with metallopeptidase domain